MSSYKIHLKLPSNYKLLQKVWQNQTIVQKVQKTAKAGLWINISHTANSEYYNDYSKLKFSEFFQFTKVTKYLSYVKLLLFMISGYFHRVLMIVISQKKKINGK